MLVHIFIVSMRGDCYMLQLPQGKKFDLACFCSLMLVFSRTFLVLLSCFSFPVAL